MVRHLQGQGLDGSPPTTLSPSREGASRRSGGSREMRGVPLQVGPWRYQEVTFLTGGSSMGFRGALAGPAPLSRGGQLRAQRVLPGAEGGLSAHRLWDTRPLEERELQAGGRWEHSAGRPPPTLQEGKGGPQQTGAPGPSGGLGEPMGLGQAACVSDVGQGARTTLWGSRGPAVGSQEPVHCISWTGLTERPLCHPDQTAGPDGHLTP